MKNLERFRVFEGHPSSLQHLQGSIMYILELSIRKQFQSGNVKLHQHTGSPYASLTPMFSINRDVAPLNIGSALFSEVTFYQTGNLHLVLLNDFPLDSSRNDHY
jgi:hypothetical protein